MSVKFGHVHVKSPNPHETAAWYIEMLDAEYVEQIDVDGALFVRIRLGGVICNISSPAPGQHLNDSSIDLRYGLEHFGLRVDDIEVVIAKMKQAGVPILQDIKKTTSGNRIAFVHGPDNVMIELSQYHAGFKS
jgi:catechol 2,3-dioxygenase-like lactoylglutathione lyase family enzyme